MNQTPDRSTHQFYMPRHEKQYRYVDDRGKTLELKPFNVDPSEVELAPGVKDFARHLELQWGEEVAARYLEYQVDQIINPRSERCEALMKISEEAKSRIDRALAEILHPDQVPLRVEDIVLKLGDKGLRMRNEHLRRTINTLVEVGEISKRRSPWHGKRWMYSHPDFVATPQKGDRVVQLSRRRGMTAYGFVKGWFLERSLNRMAPVIEFDRHYGKTTEFADPHSLIVIERQKRESVS